MIEREIEKVIYATTKYKKKNSFNENKYDDKTKRLK